MKGVSFVKKGVFLPNFKCFGNAQIMADLAYEAEQAGWDGFFIWDHVNRRPEMGDVVDPWIALTAVAMQTEHIRFGAMITPVPRRRPWQLARETVSLDHLSNGRLIFGAGIGSGKPMEWANLGEETDARVRGAMLDEGLAILDGLWSAEPFTHMGAYYDVNDAQFQPGPVQQPRIPVWVGGNWPNKAPMRRAARWDGAFAILPDDDDAANLNAFKDLVAFLHTERKDDTPFDIVYKGGPGMSPALINDYADAGATWWLANIAPHHYGATWEGEWPLAPMRATIQQGP
jgi:alkanesulfonate monooxygenase SsuD/methylene tetrahydromethanopterin reductase-like flavin-dependent oxidoreductase (luciferase family)